MIVYPVPSNSSFPPVDVPIGFIYIGVKGEMFMWDGADWQEIPEERRDWALLRHAVEVLERSRDRDEIAII